MKFVVPCPQEIALFRKLADTDWLTLEHRGLIAMSKTRRRGHLVPEQVTRKGLSGSEHTIRMAPNFGSLVFTPVVKALQEKYGSRRQYARLEARAATPDRLGPGRSMRSSAEETAFTWRALGRPVGPTFNFEAARRLSQGD